MVVFTVAILGLYDFNLVVTDPHLNFINLLILFKGIYKPKNFITDFNNSTERFEAINYPGDISITNGIFKFSFKYKGYFKCYEKNKIDPSPIFSNNLNKFNSKRFYSQLANTVKTKNIVKTFRKDSSIFNQLKVFILNKPINEDTQLEIEESLLNTISITYTSVLATGYRKQMAEIIKGEISHLIFSFNGFL